MATMSARPFVPERHAHEPVSVQVVQPIVPHYRVPFFEGIAQRADLRVRLSASRVISGMPPSLPVRGMHVDTRHHCREMLGGRVLWQNDLTLDPSLRRGDVLVIDGNPRFLSNIPLIIAARRRRVALVWWGHGWSATSGPLRVRIRLRLMRLADVVLLYTDAERDDLLERGFDPARVFALNNAVDETRIADATRSWPPARLAAFREQHDIEGRRVLLFCGRLRDTPSTDLEVALQAMARLVAQSPSYVLAVVGDGPSGPALRARAASLNIQAHVKWLGSIYDEESLAPWFLSAQCFVYPGSIGLSLIQALGYGLPVLTHDNRREHNPEIAALIEGVTGMTFPRGDDRALAERLASICDDEPLRARMCRAARSLVEEQYSMKGMVLRFAASVTAASRMMHRR
jgi:glycosyltransferase involved in cell wall biosynthesis